MTTINLLRGSSLSLQLPLSLQRKHKNQNRFGSKIRYKCVAVALTSKDSAVVFGELLTITMIMNYSN